MIEGLEDRPTGAEAALLVAAGAALCEVVVEAALCDVADVAIPCEIRVVATL